MTSQTLGGRSHGESYIDDLYIDNPLMFLTFSLPSCRGIVKSVLYHTQLCVSIHSDNLG